MNAAPCCTWQMPLSDNLCNELLARADELMQHAPGRVSVRRISHIDDVQVLRAARAAVTDDEKAGLRELRLKVMERLDGAVAVGPSTRTEEKKGFFGALLSRLIGADDEMRSQGEFAYLANKTGGPEGPARLPAPVELLDAFESWAIAELAAGRVDDDLSCLRRPLVEAVIEPAAD